MKKSSAQIGIIDKTHFMSKSYQQSLFYVNDVSSEVNTYFEKRFGLDILCYEKGCIVEEYEERSVFESYCLKQTVLPGDSVIKITLLRIQLRLE